MYGFTYPIRALLILAISLGKQETIRRSYPESGGEKTMGNSLGWFALIIGTNLIFTIWFYNRWRNASSRQDTRKNRIGTVANQGNLYSDEPHRHEDYGIEKDDEDVNSNSSNDHECDSGDDGGFDSGDDC